MSVDLSNVQIDVEEKKDGDYPIVPNGDWLATIEAEEKIYNSGNTGMSVRFKTDKGMVFDNFMYHNEHGLRRLKMLAKAVSVTNFENVDASDLHEKTVIISTEQEYGYNDRLEAKVTYAGFAPDPDSKPVDPNPEDHFSL